MRDWKLTLLRLRMADTPSSNSPAACRSMRSVFDHKLERIASGSRPRVLDLFSGCGGISLGFQRAGFEIAGAVELDPDAARSHGMNFHQGSSAHSKSVDITTTSPFELAEDLDLESVEGSIDVITGGPPCQAFARVGRSKLREVESHPRAFILDPRAQLFRRYLSYVRAFMPLAVLMENVPDILNHGGHNVAEEICESLSEIGYVASYTLLNAALYGVPQMRERMFLVAYRRELGIAPTFPQATHWMDLPPGYEGSRNVALKALRSMSSPSRFYTHTPPSDPSLTPAVTAAQAIDDLPSIDPGALIREGLLARRRANISAYSEYRSDGTSDFQKEMRQWPSFESDDRGATAHVIRYLPRDYRIFSRMRQGDQYPEAHKVAEEIFKEELLNLRIRGIQIPANSKNYSELYATIVPPYDPTKFPNKWRKMWSNQPARTLMAHLGKDSYSHIHYSQGRTISVREAARLQSFPDGFKFNGAMNTAFRQIGNAVPPLMSYQLAREMMLRLNLSASEVKRQLPEGQGALT
ncbi:DNA cytosine methyltransferase [Stenotrophomonas maltophilia]|nr:DNA cytosine methyltransferase [Stenotrophomonas maltophilia]MBH1615912.1 DNA cytosine methyltransferase [Stenotrophomonas maltophilia]MBN5169257.1 DNA cytosine methyltransferase [Stenotrophomonas maltophilia]